MQCGSYINGRQLIEVPVFGCLWGISWLSVSHCIGSTFVQCCLGNGTCRLSVGQPTVNSGEVYRGSTEIVIF